MANKFDTLLSEIADTQNAHIDYDAIKAAALDAAKKRQRRISTIRYSSIAAGAVVLVGLGALFASFIVKGSASNKSADSAQPEQYALTAGFDESSYADAQSEPEPSLLEACIDGGAEADCDMTVSDSASSSMSANGTIVEEEFDIVFIGELDFSRTTFPESEVGTGKNLMYLVSSEPTCALEIGEAVITDEGEKLIACWRTSDTDYLSITAYGYARNELIDIMESMCG